MSKFNAAKVQRIEWDFTGTPHRLAGTDENAPREVEGEHVVGVLPEPTPQQVADFLQGYAEIVDAGAQLLRDAAGDGDKDTLEKLDPSGFYLQQFDRSVETLASIGVPRELLEQLPPRLMREFLHHVSEDLQGEGGAA